MIRLLITTVFSIFMLLASGQVKENKDSILLKSHVFRVTLLGTGDPQPIMERFGPSILVQAGSEILLFDAGRGCLQRLNQINLSYDKLNALFFTHLHSDHIVGLPDLWLTGWLISKRSVPLTVYGPIGTSDMIKNLQQAFSFDINIRIEDDKAPVNGSRLSVTEIHQGTVYEKNGVKVIAFDVDHGPVKPSFGYRIEYNGYAVVLSGDTRYSENLITFAKGTDLLVHEVVIAPDTLSKSDPKYAIFAHHSTPEQVSMVFNKVKPKLAVFSHIVKLYGHNEQELLKRTQTKYSGSIIIGEDLMSFTVNDSVSICRWQKK